MTTTRTYTLDELTGLNNSELVDVFSKNPRTYMAVKGAVAEKHLEKQLVTFRQDGLIKNFRGCLSDFEKDFYVTLNNGNEVILECKNVEVLKTNKKGSAIGYIAFLVRHEYLTIDRLRSFCFEDETCRQIAKPSKHEDFHDVDGVLGFLIDQKSSFSTQILKYLPQEFRESGMPRYEYSKSLLEADSTKGIDSTDFLNQFNSQPLSIDFQRTRNSTDNEGDNRRGRLYEVGEIDVVGACLFSRTLKWEFIYGLASGFATHDKYPDRYKNGLVINPESWTTSFADAISSHIES